MSLENNSHFLNQYFGKKWLRAKLPKQVQPWIMGPYNKSVKRDNWISSIRQELREHLSFDSWQWPKRVVYFFSDMHADTDAFIDSLIASGGISSIEDLEDLKEVGCEGAILGKAIYENKIELKSLMNFIEK